MAITFAIKMAWIYKHLGQSDYVLWHLAILHVWISIYKNTGCYLFLAWLSQKQKKKIRIKSTNRQYQSISHPMCNNRLTKRKSSLKFIFVYYIWEVHYFRWRHVCEKYHLYEKILFILFTLCTKFYWFFCKVFLFLHIKTKLSQKKNF